MTAKPWTSLMRFASFLRICLLLVFAHRLFELLVELVRDRSRESSRGPLPRPCRRRSCPRRTVPALRGIRLRSEADACCERRLARIDDEVILVIDDALELCARVMSSIRPMRDGMHLKNQMCVTGTASSMWPMRSRRTRASVTSTPQRSQMTPLMLDALVFSAGAFPVPGRTENTLAEEAALFRLEGAVIDRFRILDFALGSRTGWCPARRR